MCTKCAHFKSGRISPVELTKSHPLKNLKAGPQGPAMLFNKNKITDESSCFYVGSVIALPLNAALEIPGPVVSRHEGSGEDLKSVGRGYGVGSPAVFP